MCETVIWRPLLVACDVVHIFMCQRQEVGQCTYNVTMRSVRATIVAVERL